MKITRRQLRQIIKEELSRVLMREATLRTEPYKPGEDYDRMDWGPIGDYAGSVLVLPPDDDSPVIAGDRMNAIKGVGEFYYGTPQWVLNFCETQEYNNCWQIVINESMAQEFVDDPTAAMRKYWDKGINHTTGHKLGEHESPAPD